jgi:hypothetical protein
MAEGKKKRSIFSAPRKCSDTALPSAGKRRIGSTATIDQPSREADERRNTY